MSRRLARLSRSLLPASKTEALLTSLLFLALLPAVCLSLDLYHSLYRALWVLLRLTILEPESDLDLLTKLAAENAERVEEAKWVVEGLQEMRQGGGGNGSGWGRVGAGGGVKWKGGWTGDDDDDIQMIRISIVIISSRRESYFDGQLRYDPKYLLQNFATFTSILQQRSHLRHTRYSLSICSVTDGDLTAEEEYLSRITTLVRIPQPSAETTFGSYHDILAWPYEKEKRDYAFCLRHGSAEGADYVMMVEDDAIPQPEALNVVDKVVIRRRARLKFTHQTEIVNEEKDLRNSRHRRRLSYALNDDKNTNLVEAIGTDQREGSEDLLNIMKAGMDGSKPTLKILHKIPRIATSFLSGRKFSNITTSADGESQANGITAVAWPDVNDYVDRWMSRISDFNASPSVKRTEEQNVAHFGTGASDDMFYAKLYHPRRVQGYLSVERERLPQLLGISLLLGSVIYACSWLFAAGKFSTRLFAAEKIAARDSNMLERNRRSFNARATWVRCCLVAALVSLTIGRPHMEAWRRWFAPWLHYAVPDVQCCTQAVLYSPGVARELSQYLDLVECNERFHKDDAVWAFNRGRLSSKADRTEGMVGYGRSMKPVEGYLIQPNVFEHIGVWSALRKSFVDPHLIVE